VTIVERTAIRLSDGRELIYFNEHAGAHRERYPDTRHLPPPPETAQLRLDPLVDEWVAVNAHRQERTYLPPSDRCPLCPSTPDFASEIPAPDYDVVVFENQFPSLSDRVAPDEITEVTGMVPVRPGVGRCEVVCFTSDHNSSFGALAPERVRTVVDALADRTTEMSALTGVAQVFPFENRGAAIGVTLGHPHGQIYAYPYVTPRSRLMLGNAARHFERTGQNLFADVLSGERSSSARVVVASDHWTAFVPAASRWPVEVHLYPHRRVLDIPSLTDAERDDFAEVYLDVLRRLDGLYDMPLPYVAAWHQAPVADPLREHAYLHLQVSSIQRSADKLKYLAGSETGMGAFITDVLPEDVAERLRTAGS
jgi:UDPglucose--hexose-1-phosphate uridylyltransferase